MVHNKNNKQRHSLYVGIITLFLTPVPIRAELSSLAKNDPYPVFSTLNIDELFLLTAEQLKFKDPDWAKRKKSRVNFSISPFTQNADRGKAITDQPCPPTVINPLTTPLPCPDINDALGDLTGATNMLALLYGKFPASANNMYPGGVTGYLTEAFFVLFDNTSEEPGKLTNAQYLDPYGLTGAFSFTLKYRKRGVRFELDARIWDDIGIRVQAGVSSIRQTRENTINLNDTVQTTDPTKEAFLKDVDITLMEQVDNIAAQMGVYIGDTNHASAEEVRLNLFWRHAYEVNKDADDWTHFLCIPYAEVSGSFSPGDARNSNELFAVPFGNENILPLVLPQELTLILLKQ